MTRTRPWLPAMALAAAVLLFAACGREPTPTPTRTPVPPTSTMTPTPTTAPQGIQFELRPVQAALPERDAFAVAVHMDPRGSRVSGAEVRVSYDPAVLVAAGPSKGDLLGGDAADASRVDASAGTVWVSLARLGPTQGATPAGTLATLVFIFRGAPGTLPTVGDTRLVLGQALVLDEDVRPLTASTGAPYDWKPIAEARSRGG